MWTDLQTRYFQFDSLVFFPACECNRSGSKHRVCNQNTGQCVCKDHVVGRTCHKCADGYVQGSSPFAPCIRKYYVITLLSIYYVITLLSIYYVITLLSITSSSFCVLLHHPCKYYVIIFPRITVLRHGNILSTQAGFQKKIPKKPKIARQTSFELLDIEKKAACRHGITRKTRSLRL